MGKLRHRGLHRQTKAEPDLLGPGQSEHGPWDFLGLESHPSSPGWLTASPGAGIVGEVYSSTHLGLLCHLAPEMLQSQHAGRGRVGRIMGCYSALGNRRAAGAQGCSGAEEGPDAGSDLRSVMAASTNPVGQPL